jgi:hypothetical protein
MKLLTSLFAGLLFGLGMAISGMVDPARVTGFLDLAGAWDPSLAFVMGGALLVFMPGYFLLVKPRRQSLLVNALLISIMALCRSQRLEPLSTLTVAPISNRSKMSMSVVRRWVLPTVSWVITAVPYT